MVTTISEVKPEPDDWFNTSEAPDEPGPEKYEKLPRFEENERFIPEYQPYIDATY
jgi:hypothetical protein